MILYYLIFQKTKYPVFDNATLGFSLQHRSISGCFVILSGFFRRNPAKAITTSIDIPKTVNTVYFFAFAGTEAVYEISGAIYDMADFILADKLADLDRTIQVNARAQKTPVLIKCTENERLTMTNLYKEYDGNAPVIYGDKNLNANGLTVLKTDAPYVGDKLYQLKTQIWNEALTYLGISNINSVKKERMITDEVTRNQGGVVASRYSRLESRRQACKKINEMFGLDIWCDYREDYRQLDEFITSEEIEGEPDSEGRGGDLNE